MLLCVLPIWQWDAVEMISTVPTDNVSLFAQSGKQHSHLHVRTVAVRVRTVSRADGVAWFPFSVTIYRFEILATVAEGNCMVCSIYSSNDQDTAILPATGALAAST